ncbi:hypothetical protein J45TS6_03960 [Paenibacillus sp. J45TS6]|uniref:prepilin-type N-terminal cleavage/methylation domain-containing protein n=1 Tax=Paenibacillus sp. J45TS6 TaxID=2807196 RepID=UPI001B1D7D01|nr:prepilin-type N-terminal cleavage/methylation domain-containing protein [Paenibacillus sp. J45TS6]GIP41937.1 hypothetical protein J45TS6_03960 [Paenibacillus sp. J45TS6]
MLTQALKARKARLADEKGFTLIELLAVIVILAIIAVIAIPLIGNVIDNSKKDGDIATARQVYDAARLYIVGEKDGNFTGAGSIPLSTIQSEGYLDTTISLPSTKSIIESGSVLFGSKGQLVSVTLKPKTGTPPKGSKNGEYSADQVLSSDVKETEVIDPGTENQDPQ